MVRTQVQLEESQLQQVRQLARRKQISMAEAVRRLLRSGLEAGIEGEGVPKAGMLLQLAGIASSGIDDLGERHDAYLDEAFDD